MTTKKRKKITRYADGSVDAEEFFEAHFGKLTFGRYLRAIRVGEELTLRAVAEQLGTSVAQLSDIEHERRTVSPARAAAWARILGYDASQFVRLALEQQLASDGLHYEVHLVAL